MQRRIVYFGFLAIGTLTITGGCRHPIETNSRITLTGPIHAQVVADMRSTSNTGPIQQMFVRNDAGRGPCGKVALIDVDGLLFNANLTGPYSASENPVALFREKLDAVERDPSIRAVVVRINSPGGTVAATDLMHRELLCFRHRRGIPVVACLMDVATGGAYYLATAADEIYAHPTTVTGGIGVIFNHYDLQETMAQFNVFSEPIKAGENIDMGSPIGKLSPQARQWIQTMADEYHARFTSVVLQHRPGVSPDDPTIFDGRVFSARQAMERGLIDRVGYLEDAVEAARMRAGGGDIRLVMLHRANDPARTPFAITPNNPPLGKVLPLSIPGIERSRSPAFLYLWQTEPTLERMGGL